MPSAKTTSPAHWTPVCCARDFRGPRRSRPFGGCASPVLRWRFRWRRWPAMPLCRSRPWCRCLAWDWLAGAVLDHLVASNQRQFKHLFPDFLDLLIVCVDTGLSLEAAIERVAAEFNKNNSVFGQYLSIINLEVRAGRPIHAALQNFAARTNIDEAKELATLFRQSQELGSSIIASLRAYSRQMRQMRMIRAEEKANELPIKMLLPLAGFLFPVNLIIVLVPVMIRIMGMFVNLTPGGAP